MLLSRVTNHHYLYLYMFAHKRYAHLFFNYLYSYLL